LRLCDNARAPPPRWQPQGDIGTFPAMRYYFTLAVTLVILWLGLSGVYKPLLFALGAASVALVVWLTERMEVLGAEHDPATLSWRLLVYWGWLVGQVILSNIAVARAVLDPRRIQPTLIQVPVRQQTNMGRVTYANSITLTPGTVTTWLASNGDRAQVHALLADAVEGLETDAMGQRVQWLEGKPR